MLASYYSTPAFVWYILGFASAIALLVFFATLDKWIEKYNEFQAWKKGQKPKKPEVVDAQFVVSRPRATNSPQLNSSTSLARRPISIERRQR